jgi:ATP-dependent protease ClpP protease subunit
VTTAPRRNLDFRPNPKRGLYLSGVIGQETVDRLTPEILKLQAASREPLTLFIDSPGGEIRAAAVLHELLKVGDQDLGHPCRLITVATGIAASAAADLLTTGDYALAYPHARILCHGVRREADVLTREEAINLARSLANSNEGFALQLARSCIMRFIFRFALLRSEFPGIRERENNASMPDASCMAKALEGRISQDLRNPLWDSLKRSEEIEAWDQSVVKSFREFKGDLTTLPPIEFEILLLKAILDCEAQAFKEKNYPPWSYREYGFEGIEEKFSLLIDKHSEHHTGTVRLLCERWGESFLIGDEHAELAAQSEEDRTEWLTGRVQERLWPIWSFFVSLCRQLQKEDHWLTAEDAYWLGLVDEVVGRGDLANIRVLIENAPQEPA